MMEPTPTLSLVAPDLLQEHAYDLVVFLPFTRQSVALNLWAIDESSATHRAIRELGGPGYVQVLTCRRMASRRSSAGVES